MPWSVCRMLFESRAEAHEALRNRPASNEDIRYATKADIDNWI